MLFFATLTTRFSAAEPEFSDNDADWDGSSPPAYYNQVEFLDLETDAQIEEVTATNSFNIRDGLVIVWLVGVIVVASFFGLNYWRSKKKINCALPLSDMGLDLS